MWMAKAKQATTIATQTTLVAWDLAEEICAKPWIVELPRNSWIAVEAIPLEMCLLLHFHSCIWTCEIRLSFLSTNSIRFCERNIGKYKWLVKDLELNALLQLFKGYSQIVPIHRIRPDFDLKGILELKNVGRENKNSR